MEIHPNCYSLHAQQRAQCKVSLLAVLFLGFADHFSALAPPVKMVCGEIKWPLIAVSSYAPALG